MDKVVRRTAQAVKQAQRKARLQSQHDTRLARKSYFQTQRDRARVFIDAQRQQRADFREDWLKGPLAPLRDSGDRRGLYGAASTTLTSLPVIPCVDRKKFINIAVGDYVVILKGKERGRIDKVMKVDLKSEFVTLRNSNK
ncbi:hypothetical protein KEM54_004357, partial [Ascosphaera aggregata]